MKIFSEEVEPKTVQALRFIEYFLLFDRATMVPNPTDSIIPYNLLVIRVLHLKNERPATFDKGLTIFYLEILSIGYKICFL